MLPVLLVLVLILLLFGAGGVAYHTLWFLLVVALIIWAVWAFSTSRRTY